MQHTLGSVHWGWYVFSLHNQSLIQPLAYHKFPSDHNTRWRLLNINHNFMIKFKNHFQHTHNTSSGGTIKAFVVARQRRGVHPATVWSLNQERMHHQLLSINGYHWFLCCPISLLLFLKKIFYLFKLLFFPAPAPLCTKRRREVGFIVGVP